MSNPIRVRFAPSPTGLLNLGGARSALYNFLFARQQAGAFILRFEDTDRQRLVPESMQQIQASLDWLGIECDESPEKIGPYGPYVQSERLETYRQHANTLLDKGSLYRCWCNPERLNQLRQQAQSEQRAFKYDRHCLTNPTNTDQPHVLRFRIPDHPKPIAWDDAVKGHLEVSSADLDDFVALKSDGFPTYHLANVIDDHLMQISHVLRADEWLASTPKHLLLYQAFGWKPPVFAHLPAVLGQDKTKKLSKREGAKSVLDYRDDGYLPQAVINFLALLGWNEGEGTTKEIYTLPELIHAFSLDRIQKSPAVFDQDRLDWMNGLYIRSMAIGDLLSAAKPYWTAAAGANANYQQATLKLVQERLKKLGELNNLTDFFFVEPAITPALFNFRHLTPASAVTYLEQVLKLLQAQPDVFSSTDKLETGLRKLAGEDKPINLFMSIRIALTGQTATPPLFETMIVLGKNAVIQRLENALKTLRVDNAASNHL